jgi:hypothetical protein
VEIERSRADSRAQDNAHIVAGTGFSERRGYLFSKCCMKSLA